MKRLALAWVAAVAAVTALLPPVSWPAPMPRFTWTVPGATTGSPAEPSGSDFGIDADEEQPMTVPLARRQAAVNPLGESPGRSNRSVVSSSSAHLDAVVERGGKDLSLPTDVRRVAASTAHSGLDASTGATVLTGWSQVGSARGALHDAYLLEPGDLVSTTSSAGKQVSWTVVSMGVVDTEGLARAVKAPGRSLVLVTGAGRVVQQRDDTMAYRSWLVVVATQRR